MTSEQNHHSQDAQIVEVVWGMEIFPQKNTRYWIGSCSKNLHFSSSLQDAVDEQSVLDDVAAQAGAGGDIRVPAGGPLSNYLWW